MVAKVGFDFPPRSADEGKQDLLDSGEANCCDHLLRSYTGWSDGRLRISVIDFIRRLLGLPIKLSALELAILGSVAQELRAGEASLWRAQVAAINRVHRSPDGKETNFWVIRGGRSDFPEELCFERSEVFKIAVVDVSAKTSKDSLRARVWCVHGHLFSIEYKRSFRGFEKSAGRDWRLHCHIVSYPRQGI